jgi:hypothetical protein
MIKEVVLNSFKRTGNTFLSNAISMSFFANDISLEDYRVSSHIHDRFIHKIPQSEDFYQISVIRKPEDTIISASLFDGYFQQSNFNSEAHVEFLSNNTCRLYNLFYSEWLINKNAKMIKFEDLINDVNSVLKTIYSDLGLVHKNEVDNEKIKNEILLSDSQRKENVFTRHLPRDSNETPEYKNIR